MGGWVGRLGGGQGAPACGVGRSACLPPSCSGRLPPPYLTACLPHPPHYALVPACQVIFCKMSALQHSLYKGFLASEAVSGAWAVKQTKQAVLGGCEARRCASGACSTSLRACLLAGLAGWRAARQLACNAHHLPPPTPPRAAGSRAGGAQAGAGARAEHAACHQRAQKAVRAPRHGKGEGRGTCLPSRCGAAGSACPGAGHQRSSRHPRPPARRPPQIWDMQKSAAALAAAAAAPTRSGRAGAGAKGGGASGKAGGGGSCVVTGMEGLEGAFRGSDVYPAYAPGAVQAMHSGGGQGRSGVGRLWARGVGASACLPLATAPPLSLSPTHPPVCCAHRLLSCVQARCRCWSAC